MEGLEMRALTSNIGRHPLVAMLCLLLAACAGSTSRQSTGEYVDDAVVTAKVKATLLEAPDIRSAAISVETYKGVVQLSGFVDSRAMRDRAASLTSRVPGVTRVINDLVIKTESLSRGVERAVSGSA
jgi:hypothetical protein